MSFFLLDEPSIAQNDVTTRKPARLRNFDPRRQRVSGNVGAPVSNLATPTISSNTNKKPKRITVRQRGRARRPPQNRPKITEEKTDSKFPLFSAGLLHLTPQITIVI